MSLLGSVVVLLICAVSQASSDVMSLPSHFFPVETDLATSLGYGNETSGRVPLAANFKLFAQSTPVINVNKNGVLSFPNPMLDSIVMLKEHVDRRNTLALFLTDNLPVYGNGNINYVEYVPGPTTVQQMQKAKELVTDQFSCYSTFEPESVFVATYINMTTRYECVKEHSKVYCDCLTSEAQYGDTDFCECREQHSESYCRECEFGSHGNLTKFCNCLKNKDNLKYCICKENKRNGAAVNCKCLRDHDSHYCDCLDQSSSAEHAWNCSCTEKYDDESMCNCLREYDDNEEYCRCKPLDPYPYNSPHTNCGCYLKRNKEFCECMIINNEMESYCDCIEQDKPYKLCRCLHFSYVCFYTDVYMTEALCQCLMTKNNNTATYIGDGSVSYEYLSYCYCVTSKGAKNCVDNTKKDVTETCYDRAVANNLARDEGSTHQLVLISGGGMSFVVFNYGYWSTKINAAEVRLGRNVQRGLMARDAGRSSRYYDLSVAYGHNADYWCQLEKSTHNVPGQLIFRTDQVNMVKPGCSNVSTYTVQTQNRGKK